MTFCKIKEMLYAEQINDKTKTNQICHKVKDGNRVIHQSLQPARLGVKQTTEFKRHPMTSE